MTSRDPVSVRRGERIGRPILEERGARLGRLRAEQKSQLPDARRNDGILAQRSAVLAGQSEKAEQRGFP